MKWYAAWEKPFEIYGLVTGEKWKFFRLPEDIIDSVSPQVSNLARHSAGGRVRFRTDAEEISLRYLVRNLPLASPNLGVIGRSCADCYVDGIFRGGRPGNCDTACLEAKIVKQKKMQDVDIYLPTYNQLIDFEVGLPDGAAVLPPRPYAISDPIVFYGSSITQGAAASRPGVNYVAQVARKMDADFINLGFAGAAKGEEIMARYIAGLRMSLFVLDYDHNAPNPEHLESTHYPFYKIVRDAQPDTPILMMSKPDFDGNYSEGAREKNTLRREVVRATYERAKAEGDERVWFLDGETFFGTEDRDSCTVDACHPNDLGFYRMAQTILPVVREILKK